MEKSLDIIFDLCFGSCGKGLIGGYLASKYKYDFAIESYGVQSGHTVIKEDGTKYVVQQLPQALINESTKLYIGAGAVIDVVQLQNEVDKYLGGKEKAKDRLFIHPKASVFNNNIVIGKRKIYVLVVHLKVSVPLVLSKLCDIPIIN